MKTENENRKYWETTTLGIWNVGDFTSFKSDLAIISCWEKLKDSKPHAYGYFIAPIR